MARVVPWREAAAWLDRNTLPYAGGIRQQPYLLMRVIEAVMSGMMSERTERARQEAEAMLFRINGER